MAKSGGYAIFNCLSTILRTCTILCDDLNIAHEDVNNFFSHQNVDIILDSATCY